MPLSESAVEFELHNGEKLFRSMAIRLYSTMLFSAPGGLYSDQRASGVFALRWP
jgi:hypothetical protein